MLAHHRFDCTEWQTVQIQISWLLQKPTDLDLHCLQMQGISWFSRTRVNTTLPLNQVTESIGGLIISECRLRKWSWTETSEVAVTLNFLLFKQRVQILTRCCILWHLIWVCTICQCSNCTSPGFTDNPLSTALISYITMTRIQCSTARNNRYQDLSYTAV